MDFIDTRAAEADTGAEMGDWGRQTPIAIDPTRIFISHSTKDKEFAAQLEQNLAELSFSECRLKMGLTDLDPADRFKVWTYEDRLPLGHSIDPIVKDQIRSCDVFLLVASTNAARSEWVQRELGLAMSIRKQNNSRYPHIVVVYPPNDTQRSRTPRSIPLRDYDTGRRLWRNFDLTRNQSRHLSFVRSGSVGVKLEDTVSKDLLLRSLALRTTCFGTDNGHPDGISDDVFRCYEDLFPIEEERDKPEDMRAWILKAHLDGKSHEWGELFFTMEAGDEAVGMAYLTLHWESGWIFGNYFGVRREWRENDHALRILQTMSAECLRLLPNAKGVIFEVEPVDDKVVGSVLRKFRDDSRRSSLVRFLRRLDLTEEESFNLRAARRVALYMQNRLAAQPHSALMVVRRDGKPVDYRQPAMKQPLGPENEIPLWLMVYPLTALVQRDAQNSIDIDDLLRFLYEQMFWYGYADEPETRLPGYEDYIKDLKVRVRNDIGPGPVYLTSTSPLSSTARQLLTRWKAKLIDLNMYL